MDLTLVKAIVGPVVEDGRLVGYTFVQAKTSKEEPATIKECGLTRAYAEAIAAGRLQEGDILQVAFVDKDGNKIPTTTKTIDAYNQFWSVFPQIHAFGASQNMVQGGKFLASKHTVEETIIALWGEAFLERMDLHKFFKLMQIACQPGRLLGGDLVKKQPLPPIGAFVINAYIDKKRDDEDGMIFVSPDYWDELVEAYQVPKTVNLIKINSMHSGVTIKGVLQKTDPGHWWDMVEDRCPGEDIQMILCGNAIKDNVIWEEGRVYQLDETFFAYHDDSSKQRGFNVNASKQLQTRSGWNNDHFISMTCDKVFKTIDGLTHYDEETVLRVIGAINEDGEEIGLDNDIAVKKRILYHRLPASHPSNATQILRRGLSYIKDHLSKVEVSGFHGMGGVSHLDERGVVLVPQDVYRRFMQNHNSDQAYLFRMPYLGSYGGCFVTLRPYTTDTLLIHWQDALQMEGDFDGDSYYVIPEVYVRGVEASVKPDRPSKKTKDVIELNTARVANGIIELATSKAGIGNRDNLLSIAYDWYNLSKHNFIQVVGDSRHTPEQLHRAETEMLLWKENIKKLQVYVQQAIEGLKHHTEQQLSEEEIAEMFNNNFEAHPYTQLMARVSFNPARMSLYGSRSNPGYITRCKEVVSPNHHWHPLHPIFTRLAEVTFGEVADVLPYWEAIKAQRTQAIAPSNIRPLYSAMRRLYKMYATSVQRWNGGKNKNIGFSKDILEPIGKCWQELLDLTNDKPNQALLKRDLALMLANVAYEPQPNWEIVGTNEERGLGVFTKIQRFPYSISLVHSSDVISSEIKSRNDHKPLCDGIVKKALHGRTYAIRLWLPRPGSLFHHLVDPETACDILQKALPKMNFDKFMVDAIRSEFMSQAI